MTTSPCIQLTIEETVLWHKRDEDFMPDWQQRADNLHAEWPGHDIHTVGLNSNGAPVVLATWRKDS